MTRETGAGAGLCKQMIQISQTCISLPLTERLGQAGAQARY